MSRIASRILARHDTTENWNKFIGFVPLEGEIIVYTDKSIVDGVNIPGIKIGDGNAYCVDLPFVGDDDAEQILKKLEEHENNTSIHVSKDDRDFWDERISMNVETENIIFTINRREYNG